MEDVLLNTEMTIELLRSIDDSLNAIFIIVITAFILGIIKWETER